MFKLFLFKTVFIALTVFDIKLNNKFERFKLAINFSRKSKTFEIAAAKVITKIENEKINLINCAGCKINI